MVSAARYAFLVLSWLFLAGVLVQTFLAGLGLFGDPESFETHIGLGWLLHLVPILILIAAALARPRARTVWLAAALAVVVFITPLLPMLRDDLPAAAALHPVLALVTFALSYLVARAAWTAVKELPTRLEPAAGES